MRAQVFTLVDVARQPELKNYLLAGQLNVAVCPNCSTPAMIAAPLIYHDPAKQLFLIHFPQQLNARPEEQERFIGDATSMFMRDLPASAPKGYLLAPRRFLTLNTLVDTVLEADGISREMVEAQRARVELISQMAEAYEQGEEQLAALVEQQKDQLDDDFFATLGAFADASAQSGRDDSAQLLLALRDKLVELTGFDPDLPDMIEGEDILPDEAIDRLAAASDEELEEVIAELRPVIDYGFYEAWTSRIDAAEQAGDSATAARLTARRTQILETVERMDKQAQELFEAGAQVLKAVLDADDPAAALRANHEIIDEALPAGSGREPGCGPARWRRRGGRQAHGDPPPGARDRAGGALARGPLYQRAAPDREAPGRHQDAAPERGDDQPAVRQAPQRAGRSV